VMRAVGATTHFTRKQFSLILREMPKHWHRIKLRTSQVEVLTLSQI
ncbi:unnamed protein product, partial [Acidithrix sp. C25]